MARPSDLKFKYRLLIQSYPFRRVDWSPLVSWLWISRLDTPLVNPTMPTSRKGSCSQHSISCHARWLNP